MVEVEHGIRYLDDENSFQLYRDLKASMDFGDTDTC